MYYISGSILISIIYLLYRILNHWEERDVRRSRYHKVLDLIILIINLISFTINFAIHEHYGFLMILWAILTLLFIIIYIKLYMADRERYFVYLRNKIKERIDNNNTSKTNIIEYDFNKDIVNDKVKMDHKPLRKIIVSYDNDTNVLLRGNVYTFVSDNEIEGSIKYASTIDKFFIKVNGHWLEMMPMTKEKLEEFMDDIRKGKLK